MPLESLNEYLGRRTTEDAQKENPSLKYDPDNPTVANLPSGFSVDYVSTHQGLLDVIFEGNPAVVNRVLASFSGKTEKLKGRNVVSARLVNELGVKAVRVQFGRNAYPRHSGIEKALAVYESIYQELKSNIVYPLLNEALKS